MFSIEGTGTRYSYIRGGKYDIQQIENNIAKYATIPDINIAFNVTVQNYNLLNLKELYDLLHSWANKYDNISAEKAFTTICNQPDYLSPLNVPNELRDLALNDLDSIDDFRVLCKSLRKRTFDVNKWHTFIDFTKDLDMLRNDNILDHCPEFGEYFE